MNESVVPLSEERVVTPSSPEQISGGAMLRRAREAEGLHIAALAVALKVPVKKLEALETDRFDLLPDIVFVRALASSVCRTLKIDPTPILERLPHTGVPRLKTDESGINAPFRASGDVSGLTVWSQLSKPWVLAVLLLLVGVLVIVFYPFTEHVATVGAVKSESSSVSAPLAAPAPVPNDKAAVAESVAPAPALSVTEDAGSQVLQPQNPVPLSAIAPLPAAITSAPSVPLTGSGSASGMVVLKARAASWVEVVDAAGVVQVRKIMMEGEVLGASGASPLAVVVGRADAVEVQVRGKPFDLTRVAKDSVARFEVK